MIRILSAEVGTRDISDHFNDGWRHIDLDGTKTVTLLGSIQEIDDLLESLRAKVGSDE